MTLVFVMNVRDIGINKKTAANTRYVHRLADVHLAGFAPAFALSLCDSEYARKPPVPILCQEAG